MRFVVLASLMGLAAAATPANAQNAWLASKMIEGMCAGKAAPSDDLDRLAKRLNLTDAQKAALKDLQDASAASAASTSSMRWKYARSRLRCFTRSVPPSAV